MHECPDEIFFDSVMPKPDEIYRLNGFEYITNANNDGKVWMVIGTPGQKYTNSTTMDAENLTGSVDTIWPHAFPFEGKYGTLGRHFDVTSFDQPAPVHDLDQAGNTDHAGAVPTHVAYWPTGSIGAVDLGHPTTGTCTQNIYTISGSEKSKLNTMSTIYKFFFAAMPGNRRGQDTGAIRAVTGSADHLIASGGYDNLGLDFKMEPNNVTDDQKLTLTIGRQVIPRGWKYGVHNALPVDSYAVYRRDRFGQFRDMLEQRPYTRYLVNGLPRLGAVTCRFVEPGGTGVSTEPKRTVCVNISQFATSSLPYFDDQARDRSDDPDLRGKTVIL